MEKDVYIVFIDKGGIDVFIGGVFFSKGLAINAVNQQSKNESVIDCWYDKYKINKDTIINSLL